MTTEVEKVLEEVVAARRTGTDPKELFGGPRDWIDGAVPPIAFVFANAAWGLKTAFWVALAAEAVVVVVRLVRRETLRHAFSGAVGVAISAGIAKATHSAGNFFVPGIIINAAYALAFLGSVAFGYPLVGVIMKMVYDKPQAWHEHPTVRRAYREATLGWAAMFAVRAIVQETLRRLGLVGWLAVAKIGMGWPLYLAVLGLTLPYVKWRTRHVPEMSDDPGEPEADAGRADTAEQTA